MMVTQYWEEAKAALASGKRVLFRSRVPEAASPDPALTTVPIFWNRLMNPNRAWMLGLWCNAHHPVLAGFPTEATATGSGWTCFPKPWR
jgi:hypothetical protein